MSTYIPATIAGYSLGKVASATTSRVSKKSLKAALEANPTGIDFRSESMFHEPGRYFDIVSLEQQYPGAIAQVRLPNGTVASVHAVLDATPEGLKITVVVQ